VCSSDLIRVDVACHYGLVLQHALHFMLQAEAFDDVHRGGAQLIQQIASAYPLQEGIGVAIGGQVVQYRVDCLLRVACIGVIDGDVELEIIRVDTQLAELANADQQVQGQLLVTQVVADQLGKKVARLMGEGQLQSALDVMVGGQIVGIVQIVGI